jgi:hypothetical protein
MEIKASWKNKHNAGPFPDEVLDRLQRHPQKKQPKSRHSLNKGHDLNGKLEMMTFF